VKGQAYGQTIDRKKVVIIGMLFMTSAAIILLGLAFCVVSTINQWEFMVLQAKVPGVVFGVVIAFLGLRYFLAVQKLKTEVYKSDTHFSWGNFRKKSAEPKK
jgi:hypothetical protein